MSQVAAVPMPDMNVSIEFAPAKASRIKLVVSDVDGTLVGPGVSIPQSCIEAYRALRSAGIPVVFATGRGYLCTKRPIEEALVTMGCDASLFNFFPGIYMNGAVVYGKAGQVISAERIAPEYVSLILDMCKDWDTKLRKLKDEIARNPPPTTQPNYASRNWLRVMHTDGKSDQRISNEDGSSSAYACEHLPVSPNSQQVKEGYCSLVAYTSDSMVVEGTRTDLTASLPLAFGEMDPRPVEDLVEFAKSNVVNKMNILFRSHAMQCYCRKSFEDATGDKLTFTSSIPEFVEVLPQSCSKGKGLEVLLEHMQLEADDVMVLGDAENDVDMLKLAGISVAMGGCAQSVRTVCTNSTESLEKDGWATAALKLLELRERT